MFPILKGAGRGNAVIDIDAEWAEWDRQNPRKGRRASASAVGGAAYDRPADAPGQRTL